MTVILDFLNESCVAVNSPRDSLIPLNHGLSSAELIICRFIID